MVIYTIVFSVLLGFLGPWPARTLGSGLSIVILNRKSGLQSLGRSGSQKCLLAGGQQLM